MPTTGRLTAMFCGAFRTAAISGCALAAAGIGGDARAAVITQMFGFIASTSVDASDPVGSAVHALTARDQESAALFDPALGTLDTVIVSWRATIRSSAVAQFVEPDTFFERVAGLVRLQDVGLSFELPGIAPASFLSDRVETCEDSNSFSFSSLSCVASLSFAPFEPDLDFVQLTGDDLDGFIGAGVFDLVMRQHGVLFVDETDGDDGFASNRSAILLTDALVTLRYFYTPPPPPPAATPEPASALLVAFGALGAVCLAMRRRRLFLRPPPS